LSRHSLVALAKLDRAANSPEETHQNGHKSHFSSEA